ncbi:PREDICTED: lipopolysaccharide-induced tumor necrosis factor-alpha factor homolog [Rhagoletis zephyria]|uniref:lipopolysaccharide-induced tumor necrosis factor-alpha factor homolog n=1 Tax=Rhagoletis zephyria TaxID=28612 RepID=UPI00081166AB|nr:PREDICTED: lipopolysaccharide-induced tumor necrosis factor-alpha factor homolog [Rhagoletis zephyria]XP_036330409.1 lipopolysaccharide-induced tumor necrosis factor-alpha factor homolog [Rhagoletis pomonella]XP_036332307.1 lipopolysaccharide-induced tumor necrosis factor-alpha factor homolog [Rhagoletis pomonella]
MDEKSNVPQRIYPSTPLEQPVAASEQQQALLQPAPPTYSQATGATPTTAPDAAHIVVITPGAPLAYGPAPVDIQCPYCHNYTRTRLRFKPTSRTHLIALLLCLFQLYCFVCLPYCIGSCMNTAHYCGLCDRYLGTYVRE